MDRMACVDLAAFPLQLLLRDHPDWHAYPAAVVDQDKAQGIIQWVNDRARHLHILPGMRYAAGLSLSRHLRAGVISAAIIKNAIDTLLPQFRLFTADVEPAHDEPGVFWLEASGLSLLYPSLQQWAELIRSDLTRVGLQSTIAVGFSRFGSYAAAKGCETTLVFHTPEEEHAYTNHVPLERLSFTPRTRDFLSKLGIHTLGGFLELPASEVQLRLGQEAHRLHRLARGDLWAPLQPEVPIEPVTTKIFLDHAESNHVRLMVVIEDLLSPLLHSLNKRNERMKSLILHLLLDDKSQRTETLHPASPTLNAPQILNLLQLRMAATEITAGVIEIRMELQGASPDFQQRELFQGESGRDYEAANRALARVRAQFGNEALLRARPRAGHLPEGRFTWEPIETLSPAKPRKVLLRPLVRRFFQKPIPLEPRKGLSRKGVRNLKSKVPDTFSAEDLGAYIVSGGWWGSQGVHREYHFVRSGAGHWLWVYYDRKRKGWFLHGEVE